jgi:hypothetical protein
MDGIEDESINLVLFTNARQQNSMAPAVNTAKELRGGYKKSELENRRVERPNVECASGLDSMRSFLKWID